MGRLVNGMCKECYSEREVLPLAEEEIVQCMIVYPKRCRG